MVKIITLDDIFKLNKKITTASILAEDANINGNIKSTGVLNISSQVDGDIAGNVVNILVGGRVSGTMSSTYTKIAGKFEGNITSGVIHVAQTGNIKGDIIYGILVVEDGGSVEGKITQKKELLTSDDSKQE